jgi:Na+-translocating ferredoxin:NAD+ oxidoreductase RNF subunit RnfB
VTGGATPAQCTVMGADMRDDVAAFLGVDAGAAVKRVARLLCAGGSDVAPYKADYIGISSCAAAVAVGGGGKGCAWGCVGLGDCAVACTFDAIVMNEFGLPVVDIDKCTACGDCVDACPLDLFTIMPLDHHLVVQCRNLLSGDAATDVCASRATRAAAACRTPRPASSRCAGVSPSSTTTKSSSRTSAPSRAARPARSSGWTARSSRKCPDGVQVGSVDLMFRKKTAAGADAAPKYPGVLDATDGSTVVVEVETAASDAAGAYPITPSTQMGEGWALAVAAGKPNAFGRRLLFFEPEGEHAAAAVTAGMSMTGLRATNFSSGQGIVYMHESLYPAVGKRLTYVLNVAARAITKHSLNVHAGHDDYHAVDDTGFFQLFAKDVQETADLTLIAHRIAELALNPGMCAQDGFLTSHVIETVRIPEDGR